MTITDPVERAVIEAVDIDELLAFLSDLVAIPSLAGSPGETAAQEYVAAFLERLGCEVDVWEIDFAALRRHPAFSTEVERQRGLGVVGVSGLGNGPTLIFNGHVDVVPVGDESLWRVPPWQATIADGWVYGRGALDMKGGLACALFALKAIRDAGVRLKGRLLIQSVIGEEDGGCGALATVLRGHIGDGAIVVEPTELRIAPAQAGALNFRLTVPGAAAHGCVREEGVSAIEKFMLLYQALMDLEAARNAEARLRDDPISRLYRRYTLPYALCIGVVRAGEWLRPSPKRSLPRDDTVWQSARISPQRDGCWKKRLPAPHMLIHGSASIRHASSGGAANLHPRARLSITRWC